MIYNPEIELDRIKAKKRFDYLMDNNHVFELKQKTIYTDKTTDQNSFFHVAVAFYGIEIGYTASEMKSIVKTDIVPEIFTYEKGGHVFVRSFADLSLVETSKVIDKLMHHAAVHGVVIPDPNNYVLVKQMQYEVDKYQKYQIN